LALDNPSQITALTVSLLMLEAVTSIADSITRGRK
jgi:hypothetical protein